MRADTPASLEAFLHYGSLSTEQLEKRLAEEHERAKLLDEKTSKMTLAFTLGLGILGAAGTLVRSLGQSTIISVLQCGIVLSAIYILTAGFLALAAFRTFPLFGYGTEFLVAIKDAAEPKQIYLDCLFRQEKANQIRQIRNEAAFQSLRNGFVIFAVVLIVYLIYPIPKPHPPIMST
jgi:hypothetical protein